MRGLVLHRGVICGAESTGYPELAAPFQPASHPMD